MLVCGKLSSLLTEAEDGTSEASYVVNIHETQQLAASFHSV